MSTPRRINFIAISALVSAVAITQLLAGTYGNDLASYPDEAAHFISAVCVLDYVATAPGSNPVRFAEAYYAHFPKVAFGHWPPGFFVEQAAWYALVGASPSTGFLLVGITAAALAFVLFRTVHRFYGIWIAAASVAVYLALPTVRSTTTMLMPDVTVSLFAFMAVRALAEGCVENRARPWLACIWWSTALVLTKESGLLILLFAPSAFLLFGGAQRWSKGAAYFWGSLAVFCLATLAVYRSTGVLQMRGLPSPASLPPFGTRIRFLSTFARSTPWLVLGIAGIGAARAILMRAAPLDTRIHMKCHALWVALWLAGQVAFRDIIEARYFLPAVPSMIVLLAAGIDWLAAVVQAFTGAMAVRVAFSRAITATAIGICCVVLMPPMGGAHRRGYAVAIDVLRGSPSPQAILISSDASGAGALIADLAARRRDEDVFAVRVDKVLAASDWMGSHARLLASNTSSVLGILDAIPIRYIVLDAHASIQDADRPPHRLLRDTILSNPDRFRMIATLPIVISGTRYGDALQVFENLAIPAESPGGIRLPQSALVSSEGVPDSGPWIPRSSGTIHRATAIARTIDQGAGRIDAVLRLPLSPAPLPASRPGSDHIGAGGGSGELLVGPAVASSTAWSSDQWIRIGDGDAVGPRIVRYSIAENDSPRARFGFISIGPARVQVSQDGRR